MPKKHIYPPETLQILESLWAQGMQNCSTDENKLKVQQASVATGLVDERIKSWIYCRNRKKRRGQGGQSMRKKSCSTTAKARISHEDITQNVSETINQDDTEEVDSEGSRKGQGEPGQDSSSSDEEANTTQDPDSQQGTAARLIRGVEEKVQELQACNCDVIVLVYDHSSRCLSTTGTLKGLDFLSSQNPGIDLQFAAAVSVSSRDCTLN